MGLSVSDGVTRDSRCVALPPVGGGGGRGGGGDDIRRERDCKGVLRMAGTVHIGMGVKRRGEERVGAGLFLFRERE